MKCKNFALTDKRLKKTIFCRKRGFLFERAERESLNPSRQKVGFLA